MLRDVDVVRSFFVVRYTHPRSMSLAASHVAHEMCVILFLQSWSSASGCWSSAKMSAGLLIIVFLNGHLISLASYSYFGSPLNYLSEIHDI